MYLVRHQEHYIRRAELYAQWVYYVCLFFACDWLMCEEVFWDDKSDKNEIDEVVSALTRPLAWAAQASSLHPDFVNWCGGKWSSSVFKILVVVTWPPNSLEDRITHQPCPPLVYALMLLEESSLAAPPPYWMNFYTNYLVVASKARHDSKLCLA